MPTATIWPTMTRTILSSEPWIVPDWPVAATVRSVLTTRQGGVSQGVFSSLNLGNHVGDDPVAVATNRARVGSLVGKPVWLDQVHGTRVIDIARYGSTDSPPQADAAFAREPGAACAVMTADCLPVLFCNESGSVVAAAHAGWRGLLAGVLEETIRAMMVPANTVLAYLGPSIGPQAFEVGDEVRAAYVAENSAAAVAFKPAAPGKWLADIYLLARQRLAGQGVEQIYGGSFCTVSDPERFFSYRRDGQTGRMAAMIWLEPSA